MTFLMASLVSGEAIASMPKEAEGLSQNIGWLNLLHYKNGKSLITDPQFFLAEDGYKNPEHELVATFSAFAELQGEGQHALCKYPARAKWLKEHMPSLQLSTVKCPELDEYFYNLSAKDISLVFASEKVGTPLSMMGHLFFKINGERTDYKPIHSLSFFASITSSPMFIPKALTTGSKGLFVLEPYKDRLDAYVHKEQRNLVVYPLNLTPEQLDLVVAHIWEMKGVNVAYSLQHHNCASALLTIIAVANPAYKEMLYKPFVTPADILQDMLRRGDIYYSRDDSSYVEENPQIPPNGLAKKDKSGRVSASLGQVDERNYLSLEISPAYNDLIHDNRPFHREVDVELFKLDTTYFYEDKDFTIDKFTLFKSKSYAPRAAYFELSWQSDDAQNTSTSLYPTLWGGVGTGATFGNFTPYIYANTAYSWYGDKNTAILAPEVGAFYYWGELSKTHLSATKYVYSNNYMYDTKFSATQNFFIQNGVAGYAAYDHIKQPARNRYDDFKIGLRVSF